MAEIVRTDINGVLFDALIDETVAYKANIPQYPTEEGFSVSDNMSIEPFELQLTLYVSDTPVTYSDETSLGRRSIEKIAELEEMWLKRELVTIKTTSKTYENYGITSISVSHDKKIGFAREVDIKFKQVRTTSTKTFEVPPDLRKAPASKGNGGKAKSTSSSSKGEAKEAGPRLEQEKGFRDTVPYHERKMQEFDKKQIQTQQKELGFVMFDLYRTYF